MKVLRLHHFLDILRGKARERDNFMDEIRVQLRAWAESGGKEFHPFQHGDFFGQMRHELNSVQIELGDELAAARRVRRAVPAQQRHKVFVRDHFTCQNCGWLSPKDPKERQKIGRQRYLTIEHKIPVTEGGSNSMENLTTLCSICNGKKGKKLPEAV